VLTFRTGPFNLGRWILGTHWIEACMNHGTCLDATGKNILSLRESNPYYPGLTTTIIIIIIIIIIIQDNHKRTFGTRQNNMQENNSNIFPE
jgi:hypothetical protein